MKKTSINILCILIILLITGSVVAPVWYLAKTFCAGFEAGYTKHTVVNDKIAANESFSASDNSFMDVMYDPDISTIIHSNDTVTFENNESYPLIMSRSIVMIPSEKLSSTITLVIDILYLGCLVIYILLLVQFIRFIVNINKGNIFVSKNVVRLRRFAWYLISISLLKCVAGLIEDHQLSALSLKLEGYSISAYWEMPWDTMLLGFLALLMAQIWSYGLQIKEDQELTI